jgi:hypothetical protein
MIWMHTSMFRLSLEAQVLIPNDPDPVIFAQTDELPSSCWFCSNGIVTVLRVKIIGPLVAMWGSIDQPAA